MRRGGLWAWRAAFAAAIATVTYLLLTPTVPQVGEGIPQSDKLVHVAVFALLAALAVPALPLPAWAQIAALAGYAVATELAQSLVPGRAPDPIDALADLGGVVVGHVAMRTLRQGL